MIRKIFISILVVSILFIHPSYLYAMGARVPRKHIPLKVLVAKNVEKVELCIKGPYNIADFETGKILSEEKNLQKLTVSTGDIASEGIKVLPWKKTRLYIQGRQFRGAIDIIKGEDMKLLVVNHIDLEEYLYGVLYHEVSHRWPMEVLKAQAIAARTYALHQKLVNKTRYFDLTSDIYSQVYGGRTSETWRTSRAVNLTEGQILTYNGKVFPSYYHAACGGRTSDASTIWDIDIPVLRGRVCSFCKSSPHYEWKKELTMEYIQERIDEAGYKIQLGSIEILCRDKSGRILDIALKGKNKDIELAGNKFRLLIGPNTIRSANFEIQTKGKFLTFQGKGWGHGIGMCQWGAYGMARKAWKADQILEYYYPGAEILIAE